MEKIEKYDLTIIGAGPSGVFSALKIAESFKKTKTLIFDTSSAPAKRKRFLEGYLGCLPSSSGRLYINDSNQLLDYIDGRKVKAAEKFVLKHFSEAGPMKVIKDRLPSSGIKTKIQNLGFELTTNDYIQWKPESIHQLSKNITPSIEDAKNITMSFNNEVYDITKIKGGFNIETQEGIVFSKKIIFNVGRSGWKFATHIYKKFGITIKDDIANFGITVETQASNLKDFNKSHCLLTREDLTIGPFNYNGTILPEDHADLVISAFRGNEARWHTDKVSFQIIGNIQVDEGRGVKETDRLAKLAYLLNNDRIGKEKVRAILKGQATISQLPEYDWLVKTINDLTDLFPVLTNKANFHSPTITPLASQIRIADNLETEIPGLFVAGESANFTGIMAAAISGTIAANSACK